MSIFGGIGSWIERHCGELQLGIWMSLMMCLPHQRRKVYIKDKFDKHSQAAKDNQKYPKVVTNWAKWEHTYPAGRLAEAHFSLSAQLMRAHLGSAVILLPLTKHFVDPHPH